MKKAFLFTGKEVTGEKTVESYQLLVGLDYIPASYDYSKERAVFYEEISDAFASRMLQEMSPLELGVVNGVRINLKTKRPERIQKLEEEHIAQLTERISVKLQENIEGIVVPAPSQN